MNIQRILVTGSDGFVGNHLCARLLTNGFTVRGAVCPQFGGNNVTGGVEYINIQPISAETDWSNALKDIDIVFHLAARVHVMNEKRENPLLEYRKVNVRGTQKLAEDAAKAGVRRLVYVSSIKVNAEPEICKDNGIKLVSESDFPNPAGPYAVSKYEAEMTLKEISKKAGLEVVILRPPLVYGPNVKANFLKMMEAVDIGMPLPLHSLNNKKHFIYVGNLVDALIVCALHPNAVNETFLVNDDESISTPELIRMMAICMGKKARLLPFPLKCLYTCGKSLGMGEQLERVMGSLCVNGDKIRNMLNWRPPYRLQDGIGETIKWYQSL